MKPRTAKGFLVLLAALVVASGGGLALRWRDATLLRADVERLRLETDELTRLRAENERLRSRQVSAAELEMLRADHAALPRLRAEIEALKKRPPAVEP